MLAYRLIENHTAVYSNNILTFVIVMGLFLGRCCGSATAPTEGGRKCRKLIAEKALAEEEAPLLHQSRESR